MKIGMVTACYRPVANGVTRMVSMYRRHLEQLGHEVTIFTLGPADPSGDEPGVMRSPALCLGAEGYHFALDYSREARARLRQMDVIHCHHPFMGLELAHRHACCPIVFTNHTRYDLYARAYGVLPQLVADLLMRKVWLQLASLADEIVSPSQSMHQLLRFIGIRQPIEVIENGIDIEPFQRPQRPLSKACLGIPERAVVLAYVGRMAPVKNLPVVLEQFAAARRFLPALYLLLIGDGPVLPSLMDEVEKRGLKSFVRFTGTVDNTTVADYLAATDIFVTASVSEVHPVSILEAMAAGLPIVAVASPGIVETVEHGRSGLLTNVAEHGLSAAIVELAANEGRRRWMGANGRRRAAERFDIRLSVARTVSLYEKLCATRPDLQRKRVHGRWHTRRNLLVPVVTRLSHMFRTPPQGCDPFLDRLRTKRVGTPIRIGRRHHEHERPQPG